MLRLIVTDLETTLDGQYPHKYVYEATSFLPDGYWFNPYYKRGQSDGRRRFLKAARGQKPASFPTGLLSRVVNVLTEHNWAFELDDRRGDYGFTPVLQLHDSKLKVIDLTQYPFDYQGQAVEAIATFGRGIIKLGTNGGKCLGEDTPILLFNGDLKKVQDVEVGDLLMGPDSNPRRVLSTTCGQGRLFKITPSKSTAWVCNEDHVLTLQDTVRHKVFDIPLKDYLRGTRKFKQRSKQFAVGVEFPETQVPLVIDPYFLGVWLGGGSKSCSYNGLVIDDKLLTTLRELVATTFCIPKQYLTSSRSNRLQLLAGLLDTDGRLHNGSFEITQRREELADGIVFLARSLGFRVTVSDKYVNGQKYIRMGISGDCSCIPTRIPRKKSPPRKRKTDVLRHGFTVEDIGFGRYFGFTLTGDGRFLLGDFTVTHNTEVGAGIIKSAGRKALWLINRKYLAYQTRDRLRDRLEAPVGFIGDSIYEPENVTVAMSQTLSAMLKAKDTRFDVLRDCQVVIGDEVHHLESGQWYDIFAEIQAPIRVGLSATPTEGGYGMYLEAQTGPIVIDVPARELLERGINVQPRIWFCAVEEPRIPNNLPAKNVYDIGVVCNTHRNKLVAQIARQLVADRKPPLILSGRISQVEVLCELLGSAGVRVGKITGSVSQKERETYLAGLRTGDVQAIVGMVSVLGEGVDVGDIRSIVNACGSRGGSGTDSESGRQIVQILGRGLRRSKASAYLPDKTSFDYVDFLDLQHKALRESSLSRLNAIEKEGYKDAIKRWSEYFT